MRHPEERQIAWYAGGEAGWWERLALKRHFARCGRCRALADAYRADRVAIKTEALHVEPELNWEALAAEMTANIRLGLEAGECVGDVTPKQPALAWRPALAATGLVAVLALGWYLNFPDAQRESLARGIGRAWNRTPAAGQSLQQAQYDAGVSLESTRNGIQVSENGAALTMMTPGATPTMVVVNTGGSLRARYVDDDTGQVTITNVYAQ